MESPDFTDDDRALLMALDAWEDTLCPGPCGQPKAKAWHTDTDGWWEHASYHCYACSEIRGDDVVYDGVRSTLPEDRVLSPFELGVTTFSPDD